MLKKSLLVAAITAISALGYIAPSVILADTAPAPTSQPARRHPVERLKDAVEQLNLSEEQKTQIQQFLADARAKVNPIMEAAKTGDREKARDEIRDVIKDTLKQITGVLTDEQKEKLKSIIQQERPESRPAK